MGEISPLGEFLGRQGRQIVLKTRQKGHFVDEFGKTWYICIELISYTMYNLFFIFVGFQSYLKFNAYYSIFFSGVL